MGNAPETDPTPNPDPIPDPPVEPPTDPVEPPKSEAADDVKEILTSLVNSVDSLKDVVEGLIPTPGDPITELPGDGDVIPDENPVKKPWHKRGLFT